jgi:hypothetical protein
LNEIHNHLKIHERILGYEQPYSTFNSGRPNNIRDAGHPSPSKIKSINLEGHSSNMSETASTISRAKFSPIDVQTMVP